MSNTRDLTLLCDLDGTLVDSAPDLQWCLNRLLKERGLIPLSRGQVIGMVGDGVKKLVERGFFATGASISERENESLVAQFLELYGNHCAVETKPYDGVVDALSDLKRNGWRLAICTNKPEAASCRILDALDLSPLFDAVSGGDSFTVRKPHPGHLLKTLEAMGAEKEGAVMLGDGANDAAAARAAGLPVVLVSFGYGKAPLTELCPDRIIDSFAELPAALARLTAARA